MANIAYEVAVRVGTVAHLLSQKKRYPEESAEREMAEERLRPLKHLNLPGGRPVYWLHAVSMGEVGVANVLVRELKRLAPGALAVISTSTATGYDAARKIKDVDAVVASRFDIRDLVSTMFEAIRPTAIILVEGDLWRNMMALANRRGVPVFVANAKLSEKSLAFYTKFPVYSRSLFSRIAHVYAQTELYQSRFLEAGLAAERCEVSGNVKLDMAVTTPAKEELEEITKTAGCEGADKIVTFGSLHPGEEIPAIHGMLRVWERHPGAQCLIAPRHIEKTPQFIESIRREFDLECRIYSQTAGKDEADGLPSPHDTRITIVDRMGLLMKLYALADIGVVGGTFVAGVGGHNLTEPAFLGKPVIYGPYVYKQPGLHDLVTAYDAGRQATEENFPDVLASLIDDADGARQIGLNGERMVADSRGVAARIVGDILERTGES